MGDATYFRLDAGGTAISAEHPLPVSSSGTGTTSDQVQGNVADDAVDVGNPVKIGGIANPPNDAGVSGYGDRVNANFDNRGSLGVYLVDGHGGTAITKPSTGTFSQVASSASAGTILAANTNRKGAKITNTDANILYIMESPTTVTTANYSVPIPANGGYYEVAFGYTGIITGIWAADGAGNANVTELT